MSPQEDAVFNTLAALFVHSLAKENGRTVENSYNPEVRTEEEYEIAKKSEPKIEALYQLVSKHFESCLGPDVTLLRILAFAPMPYMAWVLHGKDFDKLSIKAQEAADTLRKDGADETEIQGILERAKLYCSLFPILTVEMEKYQAQLQVEQARENGRLN